MGTWKEVPPPEQWGQMEERVLAFWRENDVFAASVTAREGSPPYVFYEGPPTANGRPGSHHVLSRVFKDIFPRFHTMRGRKVERRGGWDCHGLPVELEVERQLGISSKPEIEAYGIAEFNAKCRESVVTYLEEWERLTERIGFWVDTETAYRTMDSSYIESVWWSLAELWDRGLVYESHKVVPYCTRCGTPLSSHEVAQGYQEIDDPSIYVRFPVRDSDAVLLVWTTTPWTLPANQAVAINPELEYVEADLDGERLIVARALVHAALGDAATVVREVPVDQLVGAHYEPPFPFIEGAHVVISGEFVTTEDGTGLVHLAPAFGQDDYVAGQQHGLDAPNPVDLDGRFTDQVPSVAGEFFKDADPALIDDLRDRGRLFRAASYTHTYPHCWRDGSPLIYYAMPSWYVRTTKVRDRMLALNSDIGWHPEHVRDGRFGKWLEGNVDWAISRRRYWGTPLPFWRCDDCGDAEAVGSFARLAERAGVQLGEGFDPHRPFVDDLVLACESCGGTMRRVPEVVDVWYDSGAMPFAQQHHPFDDGRLEGRFPADFICEALDQTRGWFYSLLAEATLLFDETAYRNVVCLGLILDAEGQKMSKSRGNVIEPWTVLDRQGADAFRWYLLTAQSPWDSFRFSLEAVDEAKRRFLLTLWNTYSFLVTYAALDDGWEPGGEDPPLQERPAIDRWALARLDETVAEVTARLDHYDATAAGRAIDTFIDQLSNWYVRTSRRRFWGSDRRGGDAARADRRSAFATLHECLATVTHLTAPFCPFVAEEIYANLVAAHDPDAPLSVHLADWPVVAGRRDDDLERGMAAAIATVALGRAARAEAKIKVRQPLGEAVVATTAARARAMAALTELIATELNVRTVTFVTDPGDLVEVAIKPNFRTLGPRFGSAMPMAAAAIAELPATEVARALDSGESISISVDGDDHTLSLDDLLREVRPASGYAVAQASGIAVGLVTKVDASLRLDGLAREIIHAVQNARRAAGLRVEQRIRLHLDGSGEIRESIDTHRASIAQEVLATEVTVGHGAPFAGDYRDEIEVESEPLAIRLDAVT